MILKIEIQLTPRLNFRTRSNINNRIHNLLSIDDKQEPLKPNLVDRKLTVYKFIQNPFGQFFILNYLVLRLIHNHLGAWLVQHPQGLDDLDFF